MASTRDRKVSFAAHLNSSIDDNSDLLSINEYSISMDMSVNKYDYENEN